MSNTVETSATETTPGPLTLAEKVWRDHLVVKGEDGSPDLIYIDQHLVHEVTSPQAFDGLRRTGRTVRRPDLTMAVADHNIPTTNRSDGTATPVTVVEWQMRA